MPKGKRKGKKSKTSLSSTSTPQQQSQTSKSNDTEDVRMVQQPTNAVINLTTSDQTANDTSTEDQSPLTCLDKTSENEDEVRDEANNDEDIVEITMESKIQADFPKKQPPGKLGRSVLLKTNLYPIHLLPDGNVYHYDVEIIDCRRSKDSDLSSLSVNKKVLRYKCLNTKINRKVIDKLLDTDINLKNSYAVYDGKKNLYTPKHLNLKFPYEKKVYFGDNPQPDSSNLDANQQFVDVFKVIIKPVKKKNEIVSRSSCAINFEPLHKIYEGKKHDMEEIQEIVQAIETIFRHTPALKFTPIGRSFFHPSLGNIRPLGEGIEVWFGYHQSSRLGQWKPLININASATTFFKKQPLIDYFATACKKTLSGLLYETSFDQDVLFKLNGDLKNTKVLTTHSGKRKYTIERIVNKTANRIEFEDNGIKKTISKYFEEKYKKLQYPHLPCVQVKPLAKNRFLPLEVCEIIEGQHYRNELSANQKKEIIKYTSQPPRDRFQTIKEVREKYANYENDKYLRQFDIQVEKDPLRVKGRELEAPNIKYSGSRFQPENGSWNIRGRKFFEGIKIKSWCLLSLASEGECSRKALENFAKDLIKIGNAAGMQFEAISQIKSINDRNLDNKIKQLSGILKEMMMRKVELVIAVIPFKNKYLYNNVKQIAEADDMGLMTQCIDHNNVVRCNPSLLSNLCQKINTKLGGINHKLSVEEMVSIMRVPTIIMGADVSHAGVTDKSGISVAAVAGSLDLTLSRFAVSYKLQKNSKKKAVETIGELTVMVKNLLIAFYQSTRQKPEKIIFFRDGVSEGQFPEVKHKEVAAIRSACTELQKDYQPMITFVVVQKRHQVRFMPADSRAGVGSSQNMKPGTVIDTDVVHPVNRDFFLCSHFGLKGTSKPCHYTILEDDNDFTPDQFQGICNYLCYNFGRCAKSISNPVPVRYADLAAYRIRLKIPRLDDDQALKDVIPEEVLKRIEISINLRKRMYFV